MIVLVIFLMITIWVMIYSSNKISQKIKLMMPFINLILCVVYILVTILTFTRFGQTLEDKTILFFSSDTSMIVPLFIVPDILAGTIIPIIGFLFYIFYSSNKISQKIKFMMPFINLLLALVGILYFGQRGQTLEIKIILFFENNISMLVPLILVPDVLAGTVIPIIGFICYIIRKNVTKQNKK